jgi:hypothetical protein
MTDNVATLRGFTRYVLADSDQVSLHLLIKPDTDLDSTFRAWDTDEQTWIKVNGWLFSFEDIEQEPKRPMPSDYQPYDQLPERGAAGRPKRSHVERLGFHHLLPGFLVALIGRCGVVIHLA